MKRDRIYHLAWILAVAIPLAIAPAAHAQYYWTGGSADWTTTTDWSPNGTPSSSDTVYIGNSGTVTVDSADASLIAYVGSDQSTGPGVGTLNITGSTFGATLAYIGSRNQRRDRHPNRRHRNHLDHRRWRRHQRLGRRDI